MVSLAARNNLQNDDLFANSLGSSTFVLLTHISFFKKVPSEWSNRKNKKVVVLLSGYGEPWTYMEAIGKFFFEKNFSVYIIPEFTRNLKTISEQTKIVEEFITKKKLKNLILIAHSKGGLVAKYLLQYSKQAKNIKKVINIAVPYGGVVWGIFKHMNLYELKPGSEVLNSLYIKKGCEKIINIYPKIDNVVIDKKSLKLLNCLKEVELDVVGHANILFSKELLSFLSKEV